MTYWSTAPPLPTFSWASQGRGKIFTGRGSRDHTRKSRVGNLSLTESIPCEKSMPSWKWFLKTSILCEGIEVFSRIQWFYIIASYFVWMVPFRARQIFLATVFWPLLCNDTRLWLLKPERSRVWKQRDLSCLNNERNVISESRERSHVWTQREISCLNPERDLMSEPRERCHDWTQREM